MVVGLRLPPIILQRVIQVGHGISHYHYVHLVKVILTYSPCNNETQKQEPTVVSRVWTPILIQGQGREKIHTFHSQATTKGVENLMSWRIGEGVEQGR